MAKLEEHKILVLEIRRLIVLDGQILAPKLLVLQN